MSISDHSISHVTGAVLAGGRGSRMGGEDKGLLPLAGTPMIMHVIRALKPQVGQVIINANRNRSAYTGLGYPVVGDYHTDFQGPLAGIAAVLRLATTDWVQCTPCDAPALPADLVVRLQATLQGSNALIALPHDGERIQPLFALMHRSLLPELDADIAAGRLAVGRWMLAHPHLIVDFSHCPEGFANLNTPEELAEQEADLRG